MNPERSDEGTLPVEPIWSHCNECGHETKHQVVAQAERKRTYADDDCTIETGSMWNMLQCQGCEEVTLRRRDWCSEDDPWSYGPRPDIYFPPRVSRRKPEWVELHPLPDEYQGLLDEVYVALHADSRRLAMMGARALIDAVIQRNGGDHANFKAGFDILVQQQLISQKNREILEAAVEVGHASAHRGHNPDGDSVSTVLDIVENILHHELLLEQKDGLIAKTPKRTKRI